MEQLYLSSDSGFFHRKFLIAVMALLLAGCAARPVMMEKRAGYYASHRFTATGVNERVRFLVIHYTALDDAQSLRTLTKDQVSAHYLIPDAPASQQGEPVVLQLVDENKRAWHAGVSNWRGRSNLNDSSIGIEIVNQGYTDDMLENRTWYPYKEKQIAALTALAKDIIERYQIAPDNVLGHSDIAPLRKQDPGRLFPWERLSASGIGAWPDKDAVSRNLAGRKPEAPADVSVIQGLLKEYGYDQIPQSGVLDQDTRKTLSAFQMHFRPENISGYADAETEAIAKALVEKYRRAAPLAVTRDSDNAG
ncbi:MULTISPECIES: N-acetylmuramoyl-L-alanine amidase [Pantoea]|uniref:N-acetylmuramoyl-L-alanine amidase n=1 Tax=Candidatus Pantoea gossypiicola TaxID=2608008 RepID=A0AB34CH21_9GAMM|nr:MULTISPECIES: N-acetylmuramoyl-L-alanine amidase [Pantoea]KAA5921497.1 N-acetylmuramoyl-L-alanine amidase [Pantoea sp. VH_8]KAA5927918.1 N-acetylmuramoyl-L-alanine amidase [Pantoea sp. VH_4]KAA5978525.1 N-acetylmuramoyl-L-alanine amidase [Pantoea sp. M_4]KAA6121962.1 N-acetylmuramoyl-L-alanine amidase [Pantoea gossypiicola]